MEKEKNCDFFPSEGTENEALGMLHSNAGGEIFCQTLFMNGCSNIYIVS